MAPQAGQKREPGASFWPHWLQKAGPPAAAPSAAGGAAAGPVGAVVGGALGTATGAVAGTTNMVTGAPVVAYGSSVPPRAMAPAMVCEPGYTLYSERCYPAR